MKFEKTLPGLVDVYHAGDPPTEPELDELMPKLDARIADVKAEIHDFDAQAANSKPPVGLDLKWRQLRWALTRKLKTRRTFGNARKALRLERRAGISRRP